MSTNDMQMYGREQLKSRLMRDGLEAILEIPENHIDHNIRPHVIELRRALHKLSRVVGLSGFFQT